MNVTENEKAVLLAIKYNYFGSYTWANCINDSDKPSGIEGKRLSGVVSSLSKKGFVYVEGSDNEAVIGLKAPALELLRDE